MKKNKKAYSLVIAMLIVLIASILALSFLILILPFAKSVRGIQNATRAYYFANAGYEEFMYKLKNGENANSSFCLNDSFENNNSALRNSRYSIVKYIMKDNKEPQEYLGGSYREVEDNCQQTIINTEDFCYYNRWLCLGNSDYSREHNKIALGEPIQIDLTGMTSNQIKNMKITFGVPIYDLALDLYGKEDEPYISWNLSFGECFLGSFVLEEKYFDTDPNLYTYALNNYINSIRKKDIVDGKIPNYRFIDIKNLSGVGNNCEKYNYDFTLKNSSKLGHKLEDVLDSINLGGEKVILRFNLLKELKTTDGRILPYLDWRIEAEDKFNLRYYKVESKGFSSGYTKKLQFKVPNDALNEAFDYAVIQ